MLKTFSVTSKIKAYPFVINVTHSTCVERVKQIKLKSIDRISVYASSLISLIIWYIWCLRLCFTTNRCHQKFQT